MTALLYLLSLIFLAIFFCGVKAGRRRIQRARWGYKLAPARCECSWCGSVIQHGREPVTHGICNVCLEEEVAGMVDLCRGRK